MVIPWIGAALVIGVGTWLCTRKESKDAGGNEEA
jgi:hypothetical protein